MTRGGSTAPLLALAVDRSDRRPLQRQIYDQVREAVLARRLPPGRRLPSSRALANELACARNTVTGAFEQLLAEGYLEGRVGAGTYVSSALPDHLLYKPPRSFRVDVVIVACVKCRHRLVA